MNESERHDLLMERWRALMDRCNDTLKELSAEKLDPINDADHAHFISQIKCCYAMWTQAVRCLYRAHPERLAELPPDHFYFRPDLTLPDGTGPP